MAVKTLQQGYNPIHIGIIPHIARNAVAMSGIRVMGEPCSSLINSLFSNNPNRQMVSFLGDFTASIIAASLSMPFNQAFNYLAVTPKSSAGDIVGFLDTQYFDKTASGGRKISKRLLRDLFMRIAYNAPQLTTFVVIERAMLEAFCDDDDGK